MKMTELAKKSPDQLHALLQSKRGKVGELLFEIKTGEVKNNQEIHLIKKDIARILTLMHMKEKK